MKQTIYNTINSKDGVRGASPGHNPFPARMVGIRDLRILLVYYNATAAEIAKRLG